MVLTRLSFFYFSVNKRKKFYGARIDQKIEYGFKFKKDSIYCMLTNFSALFWLSNVLSFSLIKSVFAISLKRLSTPDVLFSNLA